MRSLPRSFAKSVSVLATLTSSLMLCVAASTSSCNGSGGGGSSSGGSANNGSIDILLGAEPDAELLAFRARVDSVRLVRVGGALTSNVIAQPVEIELIGLATNRKWLTSFNVASDTYTGAVLDFAPGSYVAVAQSGAFVPVVASADTATLVFAAPLVVTPGSYDRLVLDVDLGASLTGTIAAPPLAFDPQGTIVDDASGDAFLLDDFVGLTKGFSKNNKTINVQGYADEQQQLALGLVHVQVAPTTLLVGLDGTLFSTQDAFFDELIHNQTLLDIRGTLDAKAHVIATRLEITSHAGGPGQSNVVQIEGLVLALDSDSFQLAIAEIEKGKAIALPVLATYGNPASIEVGYDVNTKFYLSSNVPTSAASLTVGQMVDVRFSTFTTQPFPAAKVDLQSALPEFGGTTTDLSSLPTGFEMHVFPGTHWIPKFVATSNTDVKVDVVGAPIVLKTKLEPVLTSSDLVTGLQVCLEGGFATASTASAPIVDASKVTVKPGRLDGVAMDVDALGKRLVASGLVLQPFGDGASSGAITFELEPNCVFDGQATSASSLQALFDGLQVGQQLKMRVEGIGTGALGQARAFYVLAAVVGN